MNLQYMYKLSPQIVPSPAGGQVLDYIFLKPAKQYECCVPWPVHKMNN